MSYDGTTTDVTAGFYSPAAGTTLIKGICISSDTMASPCAIKISDNDGECRNVPMQQPDPTAFEIAREEDKARQKITNSAGMRISKRWHAEFAKAMLRMLGSSKATVKSLRKNFGVNDKFGYKRMRACYVY